MESFKKTGESFVLPIILLAVAAAGLLGAYFSVVEIKLDFESIQSKLITPLIRLMIFLGIGLLFGQLLETTGWTSKLAELARPMTKWANLKDESAASFVSSFVSGIAANTMLVTFHQNGRISRKEVTLTYLLNNGIPMFLLHLPTTFFLVVSLAGRSGAIYLAVTMTAALLRSGLIIVLCKFQLRDTRIVEGRMFEAPKIPPNQSLSRIWVKFRDRFVRVALYTAPIYVIVFLLNEYGLFKWMRHGLASSLLGDFIPVEAASMIVFSLTAEFGAGMAAAGALISTGALTEKQAAIALVIGTIVATPVRTIRHQLPTHLGLFNIALGTRLLVLSQGLRVISLIFVTFIYAILF